MVVAAALIMVSVFAGFVTSGWFMLQPIAVGLAVGVLVDAFVVRMTLVPAVLALLGSHAWWLPGWLDRALPKVDVEGEGLHALSSTGTGPRSTEPTRCASRTPSLPWSARRARSARSRGPSPPGSLLVVRCADDAARGAFLALAAGRLEPDSGLLAVHRPARPRMTSGPCRAAPTGSPPGPTSPPGCGRSPAAVCPPP